VSKPTDAAMRAARAWFHEPNCEAAICDLAPIIDREFAGLVEAARTIDSMPVDGCSPAVIESMLRQAKTLVYTALAKIGGGA
jgi:hypothetical protein